MPRRRVALGTVVVCYNRSIIIITLEFGAGGKTLCVSIDGRTGKDRPPTRDDRERRLRGSFDVIWQAGALSTFA